MSCLQIGSTLGGGDKVAIIGRRPTATYDFTKATIEILGRGVNLGGQVCNSRGGKGVGPFAHGGGTLKIK